MQTILISGASGFLGRACCEAFTAAGFPVRALVRQPAACRNLESLAPAGVFQCDLPAHIDPRAFEGEITALIHCAYTTTGSSSSETHATNIDGTVALQRMSREAGVRQFIFVSSLAAHPGAQSVYGRTKLQLEQLFNAPGDTIVKPGTIIGHGGVFQRTLEMIRGLPVIPLLFGDRKLQIIWIGDVCQALVEMVRKSVHETVILAHPQAVPMRDFYSGIAASEGKAVRFLPLSGNLAISATSLAERLGLRLPITSENLLGIKYIHYFDPTADLAHLGIQPLDFQQSLIRLNA